MFLFRWKNHFFIFFALISFVFFSFIRFQNLFHEGYYYDTVVTQHAWAKEAMERGIFDFWKNTNQGIDYPPVALIFITFIKKIANIFSAHELFFVTCLKFFIFLFDVFAAYFLFKFTLKKTQNLHFSLFLSSLFYASPAVWFVGSVWGQIDTPLLFLSLLIFPLIFNLPVKFQFFVGGFFAILMMVKLQVFLLIPAIFLALCPKIDKQTLQTFFKKIFLSFLPLLVILASLIIIGLLMIQAKITTREDAMSFFNQKYAFFLVFFAILPPIIQYFLFNFKTKLESFSFGFTSIFSIIYILFSSFNFIRTNFVLFQPFLREDVVTNSGWNLWGVLEYRGSASQNFFLFLPISKLSLLAFFLVFILSFFWVLNLKFYPKIKLFKQNLTQFFTISQLNLQQIFSLIFIQTGAYFIFMTKMHSRYFHTAILTAFFLLSFKWKHQFFLFLGVFLINFAYFLNQLSTYYYQISFSPKPNFLFPWMKSLFVELNLGANSFFGFFLFAGFALICHTIYLEFKPDKK